MPGTPYLTFDCETCARRERVLLADADALVGGARAFFLTHATCRTAIDLTDDRYDGWRVPTRAAASCA